MRTAQWESGGPSALGPKKLRSLLEAVVCRSREYVLQSMAFPSCFGGNAASFFVAEWW